jgi:tRNA (mo5U34)-methyltransferase
VTRPASSSLAALAAAVRAQPYWYHKISLPGGIVTPGWAPLDPDQYRVPADLRGKRVLDVGAWDGYWTFEALRRGARQVVAIDDFSDLLGKSGPRSRGAWETFDLCRAALGWSEERCQRVEMSVYDLTEERLGRFDVVFFFGTFYHLRHPLLALERIAAVTEDLLCVESAILDDLSPYRGGLGHGYGGGQMVMEYYPGPVWPESQQLVGADPAAARQPHRFGRISRYRDLEARRDSPDRTAVPRLRAGLETRTAESRRCRRTGQSGLTDGGR